jgi:hypothetical protein
MNLLDLAECADEPDTSEVDGIILSGPFESLIMDSTTIPDENGGERRVFTIRLHDNTLPDDDLGQVVGILTDEAAFHTLLQWFAQATPRNIRGSAHAIAAAAGQMLAHRHRQRQHRFH